MKDRQASVEIGEKVVHFRPHLASIHAGPRQADQQLDGAKVPSQPPDGLAMLDSGRVHFRPSDERRLMALPG